METYIQISFLNDFIFCPVSIYWHQIYGGVSEQLYYDIPQIAGRAAHSAIDEKRYSTHKDVLQGINIYSAKYSLCGKIDIYDGEKHLLTERKKKIKTIYDGYIFQIYAQYFCLKEMGFDVKHLRFYSMDDNKIYPVKLPEEDMEMSHKFTTLIYAIQNFNVDTFIPENPLKCKNCIYCNLCDRPLI